MKEPLKKKLGSRIREIRLSRGLKQWEIADKLEMEHSNYTRIESGAHKPSDENMEKIAQILNVEIKDLFNFEHIKTDNELNKEIQKLIHNNPDKTQLIYKVIKAIVD